MNIVIKENDYSNESHLYKLYSGDIIRINQSFYDKYKNYLDTNFTIIKWKYSFKHHWYNFWKKDIIAWYDMMKI